MTGAELIRIIEEYDLKDAKIDVHSTLDGEIAFIEHDEEHDIYKETTIDAFTGRVVSVTTF